MRVITIIIVVLIVALGAWFVLSHQNFTSTLPTTEMPSTTSAASASSSTQVAQAADLSTSTVESAIVGTWQSNDDPNYSIVVGANGSWEDTYGQGSGASETGTYDLFTSQNPDPDFTGVLQPNIVYVKVVEGETTAYLSVLAANENALQLNYLDQDETLSFTRAQ